jgi:hypothetical protein
MVWTRWRWCVLATLPLFLVSSGCGFIFHDLETLAGRVLAQAQPDECFIDVGQRLPIGADGTCQEGRPKVNQAYVWGLTQAGSRLWFGTGPNVFCLVTGVLLAAATGAPGPWVNNSWACEYGEGPHSPPLPASIGDWRPPGFFYYDLELGVQVEVTPDDPLVDETLGVRGAGATEQTVILGGPAVNGPGVNFFFFDAATGNYIGSRHAPEFNNFRKTVLHGGVLYAGVGLQAGGGAVLRAIDRPRGHPDHPVGFEIVGELDGEGVELTEHEGALVVATWPSIAALLGGELGLASLPPPAGLWLSPPIPADGLGPEHAGLWEKVFEYTDYDPDFVTALTTGMGALASIDGSVLFGTMHVPTASAFAHQLVASTLGYEVGLVESFLYTFRAISIFEGRNLGAENQEIRLLYGEEQLGALNLEAILFGAEPEWSLRPNRLGTPPLHGPSGFGNPFLNYTWTMQRWRGQVLVGTMDWSFLLDQVLADLFGLPALPFAFFGSGYGADLWRFQGPGLPAERESMAGVGNFLAYGIRTMIADEHAVYLGMANPMNLRPPRHEFLRGGGWELIQLFERGHPPPNPPWMD